MIAAIRTANDMSNNQTTTNLRYVALISLLVSVAYLPAINGPFVFDDAKNVLDNPAITVFPPDVNWQNPASRWLSTSTFAVNYQISGWETWTYHATNIALHIACGWLLALLVWELLSRRKPVESCGSFPARNAAFLVAAIWMLHPLASSAVAYIVQRSEILAACSIVGFLIAVMRDSSTESRSRPWQWIAAVIIVAGICSKTNAVSALPIAILLDKLLLSRSWRTLIKRRGLLYLLPVVMGTLSIWFLLPGLRRGDAGVGFSDEVPAIPIYLATQSQVFWHYIWLCVWPSELSIDYRWPPVTSIATALPWIVPTLMLLGFGLWRYRIGKLDGWLILSLFLLLAPTSTLIPITDIAVDHRMYLGLAPVIGLCLILVRHFVSLRPNWIPQSSAARFGIFCAILTCLFLRTYTRAQDWSSGFDLWLSAAKVTPSNPRALQNLTSAAKDEGRENELIPVLSELQHQARAAGQFSSPAVASRLGEEYLKVGNLRQAEPLLREAIAGLDPAGTIDERQEHAAARINLALLHLQRAEPEAAEVHLRAGLRSDPKLAHGHAILGDLLMQKAAYAEAATQFRLALAIQPEWEQVKDDLAKAIALQAAMSTR